MQSRRASVAACQHGTLARPDWVPTPLLREPENNLRVSKTLVYNDERFAKGTSKPQGIAPTTVGAILYGCPSLT